MIEGRIRKAEAERKDEVRYWTARASYYHGRKEYDEAEKAWQKALPLARRDGPDAMIRIRDRYATWLRNAGRPDQAGAFLLAEFETVPPGSYAASLIVKLLFGHDAPAVLDVCWKYLAAREEWGHFEEDVIEFLADNVEGWDRMRATPTAVARASRAVLWTRAEALTKDAHPSRAATLGWVMTRRDASARAIPLLRATLERFPEGEARDHVRSTLFYACVDTNRWKEAGALYRRHGPERLRSLAKAALRAGARNDAIGFWGRRTNFDRLDFDGLDDLAEGGLRGELIAFYEAMAKADPRSVAPERALQRLR